MMWCGMPNPFLWGTLAAVFNFIPYAGPTATLLLLTSVAFVSFDGTAQIAAVAGSFLAIAAIEGQVIQPLLVGRRLKLNPMLVFLALWFGGFFWGIAGVVLATPALATLKVIAENSAHGRQLLDFLSPNPTPARRSLSGTRARAHDRAVGEAHCHEGGRLQRGGGASDVTHQTPAPG